VSTEVHYSRTDRRDFAHGDKKNGGREPFDRNKILGGFKKRVRKTDSAEDMESNRFKDRGILQEKGKKSSLLVMAEEKLCRNYMR